MKPSKKELEKLISSSGSIHFKKLLKYKCSQEEAYNIYSGIKIGICKNCNNKTIFKGFKSGYRDYCSVSCSSKDKDYEDIGNKVRDKLKCKTRTENMYQNGYRKIYDSGNKVYLKKILVYFLK